MSYTITLGKNPKAAVEVHLDAPRPTAIPVHVAFGIGDKQKRYNAWLDKCFNENAQLLNFLAYIHKVGKEHGNVTLNSKGLLRNIQMNGVKDFLIKHEKLLDTLLPYIFQGYADISDIKPNVDVPTHGTEAHAIRTASQNHEELIQDTEIVSETISVQQ